MTSTERAVQLNPGGKYLYRNLAVAYGHLGRHQEARANLELLIKGWPPTTRNLRYIMAMVVAYRRPKLAELFADGLLKAGLPGEPSGYYKISKEHRLGGEKIRELFFGRPVTGFDMRTGQQWQVERNRDGKATYHGSEGPDSGKSWIEDDMLCDQWEKLYGGLKECWQVHSNPEGTPETKDEYLGVTDYGVYPFSLVE